MEIDPDGLVVGGGSAGGNLAASVALHARADRAATVANAAGVPGVPRRAQARVPAAPRQITLPPGPVEDPPGYTSRTNRTTPEITPASTHARSTPTRRHMSVDDTHSSATRLLGSQR